jgi:hypothetical protein
VPPDRVGAALSVANRPGLSLWQGFGPVRDIGAGLNSSGRFSDSDTPGLDQMLAGAPIRIFGN